MRGLSRRYHDCLVSHRGSDHLGTPIGGHPKEEELAADDDSETGQSRQAGAGERARAAAFLDLQEGRGPVPILDDSGIERILRATRRIAVVGASSDPGRPSFDVFRYLVGEGLDCVPVNPNERAVLGISAYPTIAAAVDATGPFELIDVFRRPELCPPHAREAVAAGASCLWLQLGVVSWEAARIAHEGGLAVVMNRCTKIEWRRLAGR